MALERKRLLTYEDYAAMPDDGRRYELIDGELYVTPSPSTWHQRLADRVQHAIRTYLDAHPIGESLTAPLDVILGQGKHQTFQPDVLFVSQARQSIITEQNIQGAPDLVVEVLSPGTEARDLGAKRYAYNRHGVREYWVVWSSIRRIEVYRRKGNGPFGKPAILEEPDTLTTPLLPGFALDLGTLYTDLPQVPGL